MRRLRMWRRLRTTSVVFTFSLIVLVAPVLRAAIPPPPMNASQTAALSPDGRLLAVQGTDQIDLYETATGKITQHLKGCKCSINLLVFSPNSAALASNGDDCINGKSVNKVHLWNVQTGKMLLMLENKGLHDIRIGFNLDGNLMGAQKGHALRVWDTSTGQLTRTLNEDNFLVSPDGHVIAKTQVLDALFKRLQGHLNYYTISDDGRIIGTLQSSHSSQMPSDVVTLWDTQSGRRLYSYPGPIEAITMAFAHSTHKVLIGGVDNAILWDADGGTSRQLLSHVIPASTPHNATTTSLARVSKDSTIVVFSTLDLVQSTEPQSIREHYDWHLNVFNTKTDKLILSLPGGRD